MNQLLHSACVELVEGLGWSRATQSGDSSVFVANVFFRSMMPWRDYDRRELAQLSQREVQLSVLKLQPIKIEDAADDKRSADLNDRKRKRDDEAESAKRPATQLITFDEMPEMQIKTEETRVHSATGTTATTISDANSAEARAAMHRGVVEATNAMRARMMTAFMHDARVARSEVAKLARTIVILLLEPVALRITSVVQRPDAELMARESARLLSGEPPSVEDRRAMNRHVLTLHANLFAGCPEFALDLVKLESPPVLRAVYFFVVFSDVLFATRQETATSHVLDDFRHNGELERLIDRGALVGHTLCALLRGVDVAYRLTLRKRLTMALDAAMSDVASMRQPYNRSPTNIERLIAAKQLVNEFPLA